MARMTKEELREDPVLESIQDTVVFVRRNGRWILTGAIIVAAIVIGAITLTRAHKRSEQQAAQLLTEAQRRYLQGAFPAAEVQLRQILDAYGRSDAALVAGIYLGDALLAQGRSSEALEAYQQASTRVGEDALLGAAAHRGMAAALEGLERFGEASRSYAEAAAFETAFTNDDLINAGRTALSAGETSRARELLTRAREREEGRRTAEIDFYLAQAETQMAGS